MDLLQIGLELAFVAVFVIVVLRYVRDPSPVNRDVVLVFGTVVAIFVVALARAALGGLPDALSALSGVLLLAQPLLIIRLTRHFRRLARPAEATALAGFVLASAVLVLVRNREDWAVAIEVGYFVITETVAAALLGLAARERIGNARVRLALAAASSVAFAMSILFAGASAVVTNGGAGSNESAAIALTASRLLALLAGVGYLVAFLPPRWIRRIQQRAIAFDLTHGLESRIPEAADTIWERLAMTALNVTGGRAALVAIGWPTSIVQSVVGSWDDPPAVGEVLAATSASTDPHPDDLIARSGSTQRLSIPLASHGRPVGSLLAFVEGGELFVEDDVALLALLAGHTVRAVEREEAIRERALLASELRETTDELQRSKVRLESETLFRVALDAHPRPLLVADASGRIIHANGQAEQAFGYPAEELLALDLDDLLGGTDAQRDGHPVASSGRGPAAQVTQGRMKDGRRFPAELVTRRFEYRGEELAIAVVEDITERLEIDQLRDKFIGVLSHELRTPVTAIYGGTQLLLSRAGRLNPETEQTILSDVALESERLHRLIENTLVLARVERGRDLTGTDPVLLQRLLPTVLERERSLWPGVEIVLSMPPNVPTVKGDDGYIGQVVRNLVSNAAKYGRGAVEVEVRPVAPGVEVRVLDRGPGIDPTTAERLFDLYFRAPALATAVPGAGIGLFVCRQIVHALGGRIWAVAREGGGAEFGFELPRYEADEEFVPAVTAPAQAQGLATA